jgi:UDP-N-acetylglucosamine:LPS N-acetylglucosamine transferase
MAAEVRRRVLAIASGGGHWVQLLRLRPAFEGCDVSFATVHADSAADLAPGARLFTFRDASRKDWWRFVVSGAQIAAILLRVRPHVVVTTGAMPPLAALLFGRLIGARTLWIDSVANSEEFSGSGRLAKRFATQVVTQWPQLATPETPCWGSVL